DGVRRFFVVDTDAKTAQYFAAFEERNVKPPPAFNAESAAQAFDQLWEAFDRDYAMFVLRPEVDWTKLRAQHLPKALASKSTHEFAEVCAEMLKPLRDLHVWMTVAGANVPVFNRPRSANSNPSAHRAILGGNLKQAGRVQWSVTSDEIGFIAVYGWNTGPEIPAQVDEALEQMRDTRGLIVDVRLNGGGDEPTAGKVAGRFVPTQYVYSYSQFRNGPKHTDLTPKRSRSIGPRGPWRYNRPVVLLIGQKCMSSNESFIAMMSGDPDCTIMGDHTCGSSGNPRIVKLPLEMTVSVPRWIDYLPDGKPLDERGFAPQVRFEPRPGAFEGERDDLLTAALERLRKVPLPEKAIQGAARFPRAE
ncbi:MAG TPA: S41 family peptidase, partial [Burkholderiales bacterium]|nr:S41 family peptidase [Burkholderiales bacterium]